MKGKKERLVPYNMVSPGFEAIYTGRKASAEGEEVEMITAVIADETGNEIRKWPVVSWTFPGEEENWDEEIKHINNMQSRLGELDDSTRQIRAHIASLVPCDSGFPVTVDELLNAIGRGKLVEPSFHNGCWCSGMWWEQKTSQPLQMQSMVTIRDVLTGYLAAKGKEESVTRYPHAAGFINRTHEWLGPVDELTDVQKLMMKRMLLTIDFLVDASKQQQAEAIVKDLFLDDGGRGACLDAEISERAGLPKIHPRWASEFRGNLEKLEEPRQRELYRTCGYVASGVYTLSGCHHNTFRFIEGWIHGIGSGKLGIPTRKVGAERERLGHLLFGYVLGLDKWLAGMPMQLLLLDLGHIDLGFDPKNEILRVYAYLGGETTPVKEWLAACLWHNLMYSLLDANNPAGLVRHKHLLEDAGKAGISLRDWMDSVLGNDP
jgi:hypothetical protein